MKKIVGLVVVASIVIMAACQLRKDFSIEGKIKNIDKNVKVAYLTMLSGNEMVLIDSSQINVDEFIFKRPSEEENLFQVVIGNRSYLIITKNRERIFFKADYQDTTGIYEAFGNKNSEKLVEFNKIGFRYSLENKKVRDIFKQAKTQKDQEKLWKKYEPVVENISEEYITQSLQFVEKNTNNTAGFYALYLLHQMDRESLAPYEDKIIALSRQFGTNLALKSDVKAFCASIEKIAQSAIGATAPDFSLNTPEGKPLKLSSLRGKYVLVDFWASWCGPCRHENPNVVKQYQRFKNKNFTILGISLDKDADDWKKAIGADHLTWYQVSDLQGWDSPVVGLYSVESIPSSFLLDPQGKIIAKNLRGDALAKKLEEVLK